MATRSPGVERILALLEGGAAEATLEAAAELAARRGLPLVGLLVEDADLLSTAGLPFAREIGLATARPRPLDAAELEALMRERAHRFRALIDQLGARHGITAGLEVGRGRRAEAVLGRLHPDDLLVVRRAAWAQRPGGLLEGLLAGAECAVVLVGRRPVAGPAGGGPMVLLDGTEGAERALARAIAFARRERQVLTLLLGPGQGGAAARRQATAALAEHGIEARFLELGRAGAAELLRVVRRERPQLLFVSRSSPLLAGPEGAHVAECEEPPLVLVP